MHINILYYYATTIFTLSVPILILFHTRNTSWIVRVYVGILYDGAKGYATIHVRYFEKRPDTSSNYITILLYYASSVNNHFHYAGILQRRTLMCCQWLCVSYNNLHKSEKTYNLLRILSEQKVVYAIGTGTRSIFYV